jgi:hypothetical protein
MNATVADIKEIIDLVKAKGEQSAFEKGFAEVTAILADIAACMEKDEADEKPEPDEPPTVNVTVSPTPITVNVQPADVHVAAQASWTALSVEVIKDGSGISKLIITKQG